VSSFSDDGSSLSLRASPVGAPAGYPLPQGADRESWGKPAVALFVSERARQEELGGLL